MTRISIKAMNNIKMKRFIKQQMWDTKSKIGTVVVFYNMNCHIIRRYNIETSVERCKHSIPREYRGIL